MIKDANILELKMEDVLTAEEASKFRPGHWPILLHLLKGESQVDAAQNLSISSGSISRLWNTPWFRQTYNRINMLRMEKSTEYYSKVQDIFDKTSTMAAETLVSIMQDEDASLSVRSNNAKELLHMAGHKPQERVTVVEGKPVEIRLRESGIEIEDPYLTQKKELGIEDSETDAQLEQDLATLEQKEQL